MRYISTDLHICPKQGKAKGTGGCEREGELKREKEKEMRGGRDKRKEAI